MPLRIDLLRHGEVDGPDCLRGQLDTPLSRTGWQQMAAAVETHGGWQKVITSPLLRCRQFAEQLSEARQIPLAIEPRIQEISLGQWEGRFFEELLAEDAGAVERYWQSPWEYSPPGAEPFANFQSRVDEAWGQLLAEEEGHLLLVTHAGVIHSLLATILNIPWSHWFNIEVAHASMSHIEYDAQAAMCRLLGHGRREP
jgi:alpha-ribazole phosphatase